MQTELETENSNPAKEVNDGRVTAVMRQEILAVGLWRNGSGQ